MSDLAATNCGCGCEGECGRFRNNGCCDWILWILILSCICGNGNGILGGGCGDCGNNGMFGGDCCWLIILILLFCGGFGNNCGCNNGCNNGCGC